MRRFHPRSYPEAQGTIGNFTKVHGFSQRLTRICKFDIPTIISKTLALPSIVLSSRPSSSCTDTYTSYVLKTAAPDLNAMSVKVFHLSVVGCLNLHTRSVYTPMRPALSTEFHILGLLAARHTTYDIFYQ
jgi:hypothetical protein